MNNPDQDTAATIEARLRELGDPVRAANEKRYLKSTLNHYGVRVPVTRSVVRKALAERTHPLGHEEVTSLAAQLWRGDVFDRRRAAVAVLVARADVLEASDLTIVESMVRQAGTWALVDELAVAVAGVTVVRHPQDPSCIETLDRWSVDDDFWVRRAALLALLPQVRALPQEPEVLTGDQVALLARLESYAGAMLSEREFFIRKAIGWVMREVSRRRPDWVRSWLAANGDRASAVTRREASRRLPADDSRHASPQR